MNVEESDSDFLNKLNFMLDLEKRSKDRFLKEFTNGLINASYTEKVNKKNKSINKISIIDPVLKSIVHN